MLSARTPDHARLRFVGKEPETRCPASSLRHDRGLGRAERLPMSTLTAGAHGRALLLQQPPRNVSRLASRLPWFDNSIRCVWSAGSLRTLHRLAPSFVEPKGNQQVRAGGRHVEFRYRARLLVGLIPMLDLLLDSHSRMRQNIDGREACLQRQCPFFSFRDGTWDGQPTKPPRPLAA